MVCRYPADIPLLRLCPLPAPPTRSRSRFREPAAPLVSFPPITLVGCCRHSLARSLARDHGPLSGPVIKQPRGRQIESVEETRERRRRGDGQPAATMVSIVKGLSWRVRVPPLAESSRTRRETQRGEGSCAEEERARERWSANSHRSTGHLDVYKPQLATPGSDQGSSTPPPPSPSLPPYSPPGHRILPHRLSALLRLASPRHTLCLA